MHHTVPYTMYNMFNRFAIFDLLSTLGMALVRVVMWSNGKEVTWMWSCGHMDVVSWLCGSTHGNTGNKARYTATQDACRWAWAVIMSDAVCSIMTVLFLAFSTCA